MKENTKDILFYICLVLFGMFLIYGASGKAFWMAPPTLVFQGEIKEVKIVNNKYGQIILTDGRSTPCCKITTNPVPQGKTAYIYTIDPDTSCNTCLISETPLK